MKRTIIVLAAALALPGSALAADNKSSAAKGAAKACKAERDAMGKATFRATYGTNKKRRNAFGKCVSKQTRAERADARGASEACKAEREADREAFTAKYGTGKKGRNALGKCISAQRKEAREERSETRVNAAKACKTERRADSDAFREKYGTNRNKRNAFGKCVSQTAKAMAEAEEEQPETETEEGELTA